MSATYEGANNGNLSTFGKKSCAVVRSQILVLSYLGNNNILCMTRTDRYSIVYYYMAREEGVAAAVTKLETTRFSRAGSRQ